MISGVPPTGPTHDAIVAASGAPPAAQAGTSGAAWAMAADVADVADGFGSAVAGAADETGDGAPGDAAAVGAAAAAVGTGVGDDVEHGGDPWVMLLGVHGALLLQQGAILLHPQLSVLDPGQRTAGRKPPGDGVETADAAYINGRITSSE